MPKKSKSEPAIPVKSRKIGRSPKSRKAVPHGIRPETPTRELPFSDAMGTGTIIVNPHGGVTFSEAGATVRVHHTNIDAGPRDLPSPRSAWMLFGSDDSYQGDDDLAEDGGCGEWNAAKNVEIGDALFFYFKAPRTAIHFVARATSEPEVGDPLSSNPEGRPQYWLDYECMVRIHPITLSEIRTIFQEKHFLPFVMGARYLRPDLANCLLERARVAFSPSEQCSKNALQRVRGRKELGDPRSIDLAGLRALPTAAFKCEEEVEYHLVEPLLRLTNVSRKARIQRKYDLHHKIRGRIRDVTADYAILDGVNVRAIIEVKRRIDPGKHNDWGRKLARDAREQGRMYAKKCHASAFVVMDCDRVFCFRIADEMPCLTMARKSLNEDNLRALRAHLLGLHEAGTTSRRRG